MESCPSHSKHQKLLPIKWINFEFFSGCNLNCRWCSLDHSKPGQSMSVEIFTKVLDELSDNNDYDLDNIHLHNAGETLLHPQFSKMLNILKTRKKNIAGKQHISLLSNATTLTESLSQFIIESQTIDLFRFSVDGGNRENYNLIRRGADFIKTAQNINTFIQLNNKQTQRINTGIICIIPKDRPLSTDWMSLEFKQLLNSVDNYELRYPHNWDGSVDIGLTEPQEQNQYQFQPCKFLLKNLVILPNGDVTVCCADLNSRGVIGNVTQSTLYEIATSEIRLTMLGKHLNGQKADINLCRNCSGYYE